MFEDDPFGPIKKDQISPNPSTKEVTAFHTKADTDGSPTSSHHTLGINRNQASPGNHVHDGKASPKIGRGLTLTLTGAKGGNVALGNLITMLKQVIEFTDNTTA